MTWNLTSQMEATLPTCIEIKWQHKATKTEYKQNKCQDNRQEWAKQMQSM
jgi:hypothetical protein